MLFVRHSNLTPSQKKPHLIGPKLSAHFALRSQASAPQTAPWTGNITQSLLERQSQAHPRLVGSKYQGLKPKICDLTNPELFSCRFKGWSKAVVVNLAAHQDCLRTFKKSWYLGPTPCVWLIWSGYSLVIKIFLSSPGVFNGQPGLRIPGLKSLLLPYVKGILTPA